MCFWKINERCKDAARQKTQSFNLRTQINRYRLIFLRFSHNTLVASLRICRRRCNVRWYDIGLRHVGRSESRGFVGVRTKNTWAGSESRGLESELAAALIDSRITIERRNLFSSWCFFDTTNSTRYDILTN